MQAESGDVATHFEDEDRQSQNKPDPESSGYVCQFLVLSDVCGRLDRLQRHPADRAAPRSHLTDLRMHRAGVNDASNHRICRYNKRRAVGADVSHV